MLELLSPAGNPEAVIAAVQNGADAVYLGLNGVMNARRNAQNFTPEQYRETVRYCRERSCRVYVTLNTLAADRELEALADTARFLSDTGADAVLVQDLGLARVLREVCPDLPLHASTQMSIHNLAGVHAAAQLGLKRVVLARELSREQIRFIAERSPIELEIFVHGALCFCHSGQCYMSALIGRRSGNRGMCAQPCRLSYSMGQLLDEYPLSLKDNCLLRHLREIEAMGVRCVKIEGRMRRPEYTAVVTRVYHRAIHEGILPTARDLRELRLVFSRDGFTDGYYTGKKEGMQGVRSEPDEDEKREIRGILNEAKKSYSATELRRVPVEFSFGLSAGHEAALGAVDNLGNKVLIRGPVPEPAQQNPLTKEAVAEQLCKTGGTQFTCSGVTCYLEEGLFLPLSTLNSLRRRALEALADQRVTPPRRETRQDFPPLPAQAREQEAAAAEKPKLIVQVLRADQLSPQLATEKPDLLYVPLNLLEDAREALRPFREKGIPVAAVLPRVVTDRETEELLTQLRVARDLGVREAVVGNLGHIALARSAGMEVRGDFGLNAFNSQTLALLTEAGLKSAAASFELRLSQVRDMIKSLPTELIVYGRLPCMVTDQNLLAISEAEYNAVLSDRKGSVFPVAMEPGDRNVIYNAHKLFLADKLADLETCGLWAWRLLFTTESSRECVQVLKTYRGETDYRPNNLTRGLYYRGVE